MKKKQVELSEAIVALVSALKEDPGYYYSWQANIAMAFKDECARYGASHEKLHEIANDAAKYFLRNLCMIKEENEKETS